MVASGVMIKMSRAPTRTRDSTSRPSGSVPNQCAPEGAVLAASSCWASGLYGAIACPKIAHTTQNKMMIAPTMKVGRFSSRRPAGLCPPGRGRDRDGATGRGAERRGVAGVGHDVSHRMPPVRSRGLSQISSRSAASVASA